MFLRILKKDMKVRKSINCILFLFITVSSVFLAASVSNIAAVSSAIDYYMAYANIPDIMLITAKPDEKEEICQWLKEESGYATESDYEEFLMINQTDIEFKVNGKEKEFKVNGTDLIAGTTQKDYCKVYDSDGKKFSLKEGELAFGKKLMNDNHLNQGDKITIRIGEIEKTFVIKLNTKDAAFGNEMSGTERIIISEKDYADFLKQEDVPLFCLHYVNTGQTEKCIQEINDNNFSTISNIQTKNTFSLIYSMDMIVAALLILIGICLILIAFLVLRFAIVFTIEEDYREIGIMKAVGMRDFQIKKIYLTKYLFLIITGALAGLVISVPVSSAMIKSVSQNMIMKSSGSLLWMNILCCVAIVVVVTLFCYRCTAKLNKISAIAAICGGESGERYKKRGGFALGRRGSMPAIFYLGLNDIVSNTRRYMILLFTFCISFILITIPLNTLNTMRSREMVENFALNPDSAVYVRDIEISGEQYKSSTEVEEGISRLKKELKQEGYDVKLTVSPIYFVRFGEKDGSSRVNIMTIQMLGDNTDFLVYDEGCSPQLENEVAFSKQIMEMNDWKIGDTVLAVIGGKEKDFIITGTYSDYMQMGQSARLNPALDCGSEVMFDYWNIMVDYDTEASQEEVKKELKDKFPGYSWSTAQEIIDSNVGGVQQALDDMLYPMTGGLCLLIMLITMMMEKLFIVREKGETAMLKSIGFRVRDIRLWHVLRMLFVALGALIIAVPVSLLSNCFVLKPIFGIMGAEVDIQVVAWKVYGVFPAVLLAGIIVAAVLASRSMKKIDIREMNREE